MRIYSWNMLFRTTERERALALIKGSEFDIFCLQEVPHSFLPDLEELGYHMAYAMDVERLFPYQPIKTYNVILSKHPIVAQKEIPFPDYQDQLPLRTRIAIWFLRMAHFSAIKNRHGIYVDIQVRGDIVRVFNLHLILAHPEWRRQEFITALTHSDPAVPTIICGDLNTLEMPHITPLNWLLGGTLSDVFLWWRERKVMEKIFAAHNLLNPLRGRVTHQLSTSQLDHILVSNSFRIQSASVLPDRTGSDHHPICVEVT